jgi:hypothetical protein
MRGLDFTPVLFVTMALYLSIATFQFFHSWPSAQQGLLAFETACYLSGHR